jgi:radical SAM protein with 4Fe4S-binding SPASM domain
MIKAHLVQPLRNISRIRLYNNSGLLKSDQFFLDNSRIQVKDIEDKTVLFVPENLCLFRMDARDISELNAELLLPQGKGSSLYQYAAMGLLPQTNSRDIKVSQGYYEGEKGISIVISTRCNMSCQYCIYRNRGTDERASVLDIETLKENIKKFIDHGKNNRSLTFIFTGGEPLLEFEHIVALCDYIFKACLQYDVRPVFGITTNGTILSTDILTFFKKYQFIVSVSLDGDESFYESQGMSLQFRKIDETLKRLLSEKIKFGLKTTITKRNANRLAETLKFISSYRPQKMTVTPDVLTEIPINFFEMVDSFRPLGTETKFSPLSVAMRKQLIEFQYKDRVCGSSGNFIGLNGAGAFIPCSFFDGIAQYTSLEYSRALQMSDEIDAVLGSSARTNIRCVRCPIHILCGGLCPYVALQCKEGLVTDSVIQTHCSYKMASFDSALKQML